MNAPIYIVSKGRHDTRYTSKALEAMGVPYFIIVEEQEYSLYAQHIDKAKILVLDKAYQERYDTFDDLGSTKSKGPGPARNFAWDHAIAFGAKWHWVMDDNIRVFYRFNNNEQIPVANGSIFTAMEDWANRWVNLGMCGPKYFMFVPRKTAPPPLVMNTRIYSCNLIRNDVPYRWRGRYNEDTDLSLRMLKDGWCTAQFNAFLQEKLRTRTVKGGNQAEFYAKEGTEAKSRMQVAMHPDVSRLTHRFSRIHHYVDYKPFRKNKLIPKPGLVVEPITNNYGMELTHERLFKKRGAA